MTQQTILEAIRSLASENGGKAPGARAFHSASGISRTDLWNAGFPRYGDAVEAAGLPRNLLRTARDRSEMLEALAGLVRDLGKFPSISELRVARVSRTDLPSYEALVRLSGGSFQALSELLLEHCQEHPTCHDVARLLTPTKTEGPTIQPAEPRQSRVTGYVYLAKYGRDYKIGRSNDVTRRRREFALLLPEEVKHVHIIETDDPEGIEQYWHRRFGQKRVKGEWFRLSSADVAAFRRRRYQ